MFCSKCGKQLSDGALFCSFCGAKVEQENTAVPTGSYVIEKPSYKEDAEPAKQVRPASPMLFDWSNVIDESHKKSVPANLKSPWDSTGLDEESVSSTEKIMEGSKKVRYSDDDFFVELEKPSAEPTRTMSFIDLLRAEREEKEKKAAEEAQAVTEKEEEPFDYSAFDERADLGYTQVLPKEEAELTSASNELDEYIRLRQEARKEEVAISEPEAPQRFVAPAETEQANIEAAYEEKSNELSEELKAILGGGSGFGAFEAEEEPVKEELFDEPASFGDREILEDEDDDDVDISAILDIYGGDDDDNDEAEHDREYSVENDDEDDEDDEDFDVDIEDAYLGEEEPVAPASVENEAAETIGDEAEVQPVERAPKEDLSSIIAGILGEEAAEESNPVAEIENLFRDEDDSVADLEAEADEAEVEAEAEVATPAPNAKDEKSEVESEIEMLKRRLAELMGESTEEPVPVAKPEPLDVEDLVAEEPEAPAAELVEYDDVFATNLDNLDEEDVLEKAAAEEVVIPASEVAPEVPAEPVLTDDMSFDAAEDALDLDAELASLGFGEAEPAKAAQETEPVAEATEVVEAESAEPVTEAEESVAEAEEPSNDLFDEVLAAFDAEVPVAPVPEAEKEEEPKSDAMSIEELERDLFGDDSDLDGEAEATKKIDKFYTLYKKNEAFQKLLDEEYSKLQGVESSEDLDAFFNIDGEEKPADPIEEFVAQQQPIGQMSMPAAAEAESRRFVDAAPTSGAVSAVSTEARPVDARAEAKSVEAKATEVKSAPVLDDDEPKLSKKELKAQKKAAKKAAALAADEDDEEEGGNALTIIAVVIALLLVVLLALIIIMNFAPDTGIGMKLNMFVDNISSYFSAADGAGDDILL